MNLFKTMYTTLYEACVRGHGKSYFWKNEFDQEINGIRPGYISVFGASSLTEIRERVVISAAFNRFDPDGELCLPKGFTDLVGKVRHRLSKIVDKKLETYGMPEGVLAQLLERSAVSAGWVLCIDDVERLSREVPLDSLLGYIDQLKNERQVKIVLLFNQEGFGEQSEIFKNYQEKVIDRQIPFQSNFREQLQRVFSPLLMQSKDSALLNELTRRCDVLGLKNIRLLVKTLLYFQEVSAELPEKPNCEFANNIVYSLLLFVWIKHPAPGQKLEMGWDYIKSFNSYELGTLEDEQDPGDSKEDAELLESYGYSHTDELDKLLINYVQTDILNVQELTTLYGQHEEMTQKILLQKAYERVWATQYHGSFKGDGEEFCDNLI